MCKRHCGRLEFHPLMGWGENQPSELLLVLVNAHPKPIAGGTLARNIRTNSLSAHVSSLRALLELEKLKPSEDRITNAKGVICERRTVGGKQRYFYRLEF